MLELDKEPMLSLWRWAESSSGLTAIWDDPNAPRPGTGTVPAPKGGGFVSLSLVTPGIQIGIDEERAGEDQVARPDEILVVGQRKMVLALTVYAKNAFAVGAKIQNSLSKPSVLDKLRQSGFSVIDCGQIQNTSALLETGFERRATLDVTLGYSFNDTDVPGAIEHVRITNTGTDSTVAVDT